MLKWVLFVKNVYLHNLSTLSWVIWDATKKTHFYDARMCTTRRERSCFRIEDYRLSTLSWVLLDWRIAPITSVRVCWNEYFSSLTQSVGMSIVSQEWLLAWFDPQSVEHFELSTFGLTHCGDFKRMSIMEWVLFVVNSILYDLGTIEFVFESVGMSIVSQECFLAWFDP